MQFEWDINKSKINKEKHDVSFEEALEIFTDPFHLSFLDKRFNYFEERWITIGVAKKGEMIVVGHLYYLNEKGEEFVRIIAARKATKKEREAYEKKN